MTGLDVRFLGGVVVVESSIPPFVYLFGFEWVSHETIKTFGNSC